jgi:4-amino-4-deoxy-L-arabinose transferase-like glycosyltransferase
MSVARDAKIEKPPYVAGAAPPTLPSHGKLDRTTWAVIGLIAAFTCFRLALAATTGLGVDETYALATAREWNLSYFDHPPLHFWLAHLGAALFGETRFARIPFIVISAGTSWLMFKMTARLFGEAAGLWAVLALNLSLYLSVAAGSWILPDGPLDFCLLAAGYQMAVLVGDDERLSQKNWRSWLAIGFWIGLATLSKYHAILFGAGLLGFLAASPKFRGQFRNPALYGGILVALLLLAPIVIWNAEHGWASFLFQGSRAAPGGMNFGRVLGQLAGEGFVLLPWVFVVLIVAAKDSIIRGDDRYRLCLWLGLPAVLLFTFVPLWGARGFPHWTLPGWLLLFPLVGDYLARQASRGHWPRVAAALSFAALAIFVTAADSAAGSGWLGANYPKLFAKGDPTLEMMEWGDARNQLAARGFLGRSNLYVLATSWRDGGKLDQALRGAMRVRALSDPHGYAFRTAPGGVIGSDALILLRPDRTDLVTRARPYFTALEMLAPLTLGRNGRAEIKLLCILAKHQLKLLPQPY